jgi:molecular chaperone DnaJ
VAFSNSFLTDGSRVMAYLAAMVDPYVALGVSRDASLQAIREAYRRLSLDSHPDHNPGDSGAAARFLNATRAYALLRDPERRAAFDRTGRWHDDRRGRHDMAVQLTEAIEVFAREFESDSGLPGMEATVDHSVRPVAVKVTYEEVERGGKRRLPAVCTDCAGSGAQDGSADGPCKACGGSGRSLGAEPIVVHIPRGVADGDPLPSATPDWCLFIARIADDERWARDGADLYATGQMPYELAVLGGMLEVELPGRRYRVEVRPGTTSGHRSRIAHQGLPLRDRAGRGDLILTLHVAVPERVGFLERLLLEARRLGSGDSRVRGLAAHLCRLQARAWHVARRRWSQWRDRHHQSAVRRAENAAASLRSSARLVNEGARLGPVIEDGFRLIAPEAARARSRLHENTHRPRLSALAAFVVDSVVVGVLAGTVWLGARYASPAMAAAAAGDAVLWWQLMRALHPALFPVVPIVAGLAAGTVLATIPRRWAHLLVGLPLGLAVAGAAMATGSAGHAVAVHMLSGTDSLAAGVLTGALAVIVSIIPVLLFLLSTMLVKSARLAIGEAEDRRDRRILREYDATAARLVGSLGAFRQLVAQARDAGQPLSALVDQAAGTLAGQADRARTSGAHALLALVVPVVITALWIASTALAMDAAFSVLPATTPFWVRLATAATTAALCALGSFIPPLLPERHRPNGIIILLAVVVAALVLTAILGGVGGAGPQPGWLLVGGAVAALVLSFRLVESMGAAGMAVVMILAGAVAMILWPVALVLRAALPDTPPERGESIVPRF